MRKKVKKSKTSPRKLERTTTSNVIVESVYRLSGKGGRKGKLLKRTSTTIKSRDLR